MDSSKDHRWVARARRSPWLVRLVSVAVASLLTLGSAGAQTSPHGQLSIACEDCHTASSWSDLLQPMKFDHSTTDFPLREQHALVQCRQCHATLKFAGTKNQCANCHEDIHRGELGMMCERCHAPRSWLVPDMQQRHAQTRFSLVGAHQTVPCQACHVNEQKNEYVGLPTDCFGCHRVQYEATLVPAHRQAGFGTDCVQCHSMTSLQWGGDFDHSRVGFPLTGGHLALSCSQCHVGNRFRGTPAQCVGCHQTDYANAKNPPHAGFPTDCAGCHTTFAWHPASFDHSKTNFPLTGAHVQTPCTSCHVNGVYAGTSTQCVNCHLTTYNNALSPYNHPAAGVPKDCQTCHTTTAWQPSTFNHDQYFPIAAGSKHSPGIWSVCGDCHTVVTNFAVFSCTNCHAQSVMDPKHSAVSGYSYNSNACYSCHPRGTTG